MNSVLKLENISKSFLKIIAALINLLQSVKIITSKNNQKNKSKYNIFFYNVFWITLFFI